MYAMYNSSRCDRDVSAHTTGPRRKIEIELVKKTNKPALPHEQSPSP